MDMQLPQAGGDAKSNLTRSRKFSLVVGLGILGIVGYFVFPILTTVVWNTLNFGIALVSLALFLWIVTNKKLRLNLFYLWEIMMRKCCGWIIELDPFVIAEGTINDMIKQREIFNDKATEVDGQKEALNMKLEEKKRELDKTVNTANAAKKNGMMPELANATRQIERLKQAIQQLAPIRDNLTKISEYLTKIYKNSKYMIDDAKNELSIRKDVYESVTKGQAALASALKIFEGDPDKKLMAEQAAGMIQMDIANKLASMKKAINSTSDFMRSIDLENATFEEEGLKMLETYSPDDFSKITSAPVKQAVPVEIGRVNTSEYDNLLK